MSARTEELYHVLRARILSGEFLPGDRLPPERILAETYGTNRNTLREAIRRLEQARLVTVRQGQGVTVRDFRVVGTLDLLGPYLEHGADPTERLQVLLDVLRPRALMIEFVVEMAATRAQPEDLVAIDEAQRRCRDAERAREPVTSLVAQHEWLEALVDASHNLPLRWAANPLLAATREMLTRQSQLMLFEPSFAEMAAEVNACIRRHDRAAALTRTRAFYAQVDAILSAFLEQLVPSREAAG